MRYIKGSCLNAVNLHFEIMNFPFFFFTLSSFRFELSRMTHFHCVVTACELRRAPFKHLMGGVVILVFDHTGRNEATVRDHIFVFVFLED